MDRLGTPKSQENLSAENPQDLLDADEGTWMLVEDDREASPLQKNLAARREVDPNQISKKNKHTQNVKDSHAKDESYFRVLKLERQLPGEVQTGLYDQGEAKAKAAAPKRTIDAPSSLAPQVVDVRSGRHPGKTRIVLDVTKKTQYAVRMTDNNRTLVVDLPHAVWSLKETHSFAGEPLLKSYSVDSQGTAGVQLKIAMNKGARVVNKMALPGSDTNPNQRIVLDVAGL